MDSTAETGTRIEIPEGSLISIESLVESDVGPSGIIVGRDLVHRSKTTLRF